MLPIYQHTGRPGRLKLNGYLFILSLLLPLQAHSALIQVEYAGDLYDVTTQSTLTNASEQVWWQDMTIASFFATAVSDAFGYPNIDAQPGEFFGYLGPAFATSSSGGVFVGRPVYTITGSCFSQLRQVAEVCTQTTVGGGFPYGDIFNSYAVATRVPVVPLPATVWLFLFALAGLGLFNKVHPQSARQAAR